MNKVVVQTENPSVAWGLPDVRSALEGQFCTLLDISHVPHHVGFLDLGGTSLDMLHLQFFIQQRWGVQVKFATLYQFSSVELMSLVILQQAGARLQPEMFCLRPCVHPRAILAMVDTRGVDFLEYMELSRQVADGIEVVYLEWKELDRAEPIQAQVAAFSQAYARLLAAHRPEVPVLLSASCDGAILAFETLRHLQQHPPRPAQVVVIDTRAHCPERRTWGYYAGRFRSFWATPGAGRRQKLRKQIRLGVHRVRAFLRGGAGAAARPAVVSWIAGFPLAPLRCDLTLIRGLQSHIAVPGDDTLGWAALTVGKFELHFTEGDHYSILETPHVRELANIISEIALRS